MVMSCSRVIESSHRVIQPLTIAHLDEAAIVYTGHGSNTTFSRCRSSAVVHHADSGGAAHSWQHRFCCVGEYEASVRLPGTCLRHLPVEILLQV